MGKTTSHDGERPQFRAETYPEERSRPAITSYQSSVHLASVGAITFFLILHYGHFSVTALLIKVSAAKTGT